MRKHLLSIFLVLLSAYGYADIVAGYTFSGNLQRYNSAWKQQMQILDQGLSGNHLNGRYIFP